MLRLDTKRQGSASCADLTSLAANDDRARLLPSANPPSKALPPLFPLSAVFREDSGTRKIPVLGEKTMLERPARKARHADGRLNVYYVWN
jgi:hypothetical protein